MIQKIERHILQVLNSVKILNARRIHALLDKMWEESFWYLSTTFVNTRVKMVSSVKLPR